MGRKSSLGSKEKRLQRKEEQHRIGLARAAIDAANRLVDPLEPFSVFRKFEKNGVDAELYIKRADDSSEEVKKWIFNLTKGNMMEKYEECSWGWNDTKKYEELTDERAWYLIAKSVDGTLLGFSHFRFDMDEGIEVLYCYELQLEPAVQRKGLGKFMMQILELVAFKNNMRKVVLTVLKNNKFSDFFKAVGYRIDESSPQDDQYESYPYEILSKINKHIVPLRSNGGLVRDTCCSGHHDH